MDNLVYVGRFQPFHVGHKRVIDYALTKATKVIILVGSANVHRSIKNPWTYEERLGWINSVYPNDPRVIIRPLYDITGDDTAWITQVQEIVDEALEDDLRKYGWRDCMTGIIGHNKDSSSYYLSLFPHWGNHIELPSQFGTINATDIRADFFHQHPIISDFIPKPVRESLREFAMGPEFKWLLKEAQFAEKAQKVNQRIIEVSGYPPIYNTVDAIVEQSGHILLIKRRDPPFAGSLALPGGYLNAGERIIDGVIRELKEETRIADDKGEIPPAMLKSFIKRMEVIDTPDRDPRGRLITFAHHFELPKKTVKYKVRGDDDALHAQWYRLGELEPEMFMADHWSIIQCFLGVKWK